MNSLPSILAASLMLASFLLSGCGTRQPSPPPLPPESARAYTHLAFSGKVVGRIAIPASKTDTVVGHIPVFTGGVYLQLATRRGGEELLAAYFIYEVRTTDPSPQSVRVAARGEVPPGTCVDVMVPELRPGITSFPNGEAALRESDACR